MKIKVGLVDDHQLFLKSLGLMLETLDQFEIVVEATNGLDLQKKLQGNNNLPELMLIDMNMPLMNGIDTSKWMRGNYPAIKLIALSMNDKESAIIKMFRAGCCAYLLKDVHPLVLQKALNEVYNNGYYQADNALFNPGRLFHHAEKEICLKAKEQQFLELACSDMTYKQIAAKMNVAERTVDGYREALFQKFDVQSRVGLCLEALRKEFVGL